MMQPDTVYYAFSLGMEEDDEFISVLWDAIPRDDLIDFLRQIREVKPDSLRARDIQEEFLRAHSPGGGLVVRGDFPKEGEPPVKGGLKPDRWYSIMFGKGGTLQVWTADDLLAPEPIMARLERIRTLRGPLRRALDSLFMLRGRSKDDRDRRRRPEPQITDGPFCAVDCEGFDLAEVETRYSGIAYRATVDSLRLHQHGTGNLHRYLGILNVGQGACAAVYDDALRPVVYIDLGFPTESYVKSAPWNLRHLDRQGISSSSIGSLSEEERRATRQCLCQAPLIVLSHADHDHWYGISLLENQIQQVQAPVLAPQPMTAPNLLPLWSRLPHTDTMGRDEWRSFSWGYLVTCMGRGRNQSGIAAFVRVKDAPGHHYDPAARLGTEVKFPEFRADEEYVLLPGDAEFRNIPWPTDLSGLRLVGLVASHHGADFRAKSAFDNLPGPAYKDAPIVYSYGLHDAGPSELLATATTAHAMACLQRHFGDALPANSQRRCYTWRGKGGHPRPEAIERYRLKGWTARRNTAREDPPRGPIAPWGNWMMTSQEMARGPLARPEIHVCAALGCAMNEGCRAQLFQIA